MNRAFSGQRAVVFGVGKSGTAAVRLLLEQGAVVTGLDQRSERELPEAVALLRDLRVPLVCGFIPAGLLESVDLLVVSPGVPLSMPPIQRAKAAGVRVWGEVELAFRCLQTPMWIIGVTGTNGKSTTTALAGALLVAGGRRTFVGGNLGEPWSEAALFAKPFDHHVIELSSFQLEGIETLRVNGAALLNLTPDHLDRYPTLPDYGAAKRRIFLNQQSGDFAVVNADDPGVMALTRGLSVPIYGFSLRGDEMKGRSAFAGTAVASDGGFKLILSQRQSEAFTVTTRALRGRHNLQNAMAATLLAKLSGVSSSDIQRGLDDFPGLPHRLEWVRTYNDIEWINDSKATNVDSSVVALNAIAAPIWLIAGGRGKGAPYAPMVEASNGKVKGVLAIGEEAEQIARAFRPHFEVLLCQTLEGAVAEASRRARPGNVVLLSPACASYDQFKNFEHRGDAFKDLVKRLSSTPSPSGTGSG